MDAEKTSIRRKRWKILDLIRTTADYFGEKKIENPRLNAEQLLGYVLGLRRVDLYVAFDRPISAEELTVFRQLVKRRAAGEPLQYILGHTEFMGLPFKTHPAALIPRPETEILVEEVLKLKEHFSSPRVLMADIGTGSGCIAVSLAHYWTEARLIATDISSRALDLAKENAVQNKVEDRISFIEHDIFQEWQAPLPPEIDVLISNPPYISAAEFEELPQEIHDFEPRIALTDMGNGLRFYRRIFELFSRSGKPRVQYILLEMSGSQPQEIQQLATRMDLNSLSIIRDLNGIERVLKIKSN